MMKQMMTAALLGAICMGVALAVESAGAPAPAAQPKSGPPGELIGLRRLMDTPLRDTLICRGPQWLLWAMPVIVCRGD